MYNEQETAREEFQKESEQVNAEVKKDQQKPDLTKVEKPEILDI